LAKYGALEDLKSARYNYLGQISYNKKGLFPYRIISPTKEDERYIKKVMDTQLDIWEEKQKQIEENEKQQEQQSEFKERLQISEEDKAKLENYFSEKQKNKENRFLRESKLIIEDEEEKIYEGVDLTTGDFIILKNLKEMLFDDQYIYEGYLTYIDTLEEKDSKTKKELEGYQVIFELPCKINDSIQTGDIQSVLQLLSKNEKLLKAHEFNYLGKITQDGEISRKLNSSDKIFNYYKVKAKNIHERYEKEQGKIRE